MIHKPKSSQVVPLNIIKELPSVESSDIEQDGNGSPIKTHEMTDFNL
jgi:hypothetical protein